MKLGFYRVGVVILASCTWLASQTCTPTPSNAGQNQGDRGLPSNWAPNTPVTVYFDSTQFSQPQIDGMTAAFTNWQNSTANTGITYNIRELPGQQVPTGNFIIVRREVPTPNGISDPRFAGNSGYGTTPVSGYNAISNGKIQINPQGTDPIFLGEVMAMRSGTSWDWRIA